MALTPRGEGRKRIRRRRTTPLLQRLLQPQLIQRPRHNRARTPVPAELVLQRLHGGGLNRDMPPLDGPPLIHQIPPNPRDNLTPQPRDVHAGVVPAGVLPLSVRRTRHVHHVDQRVGVPQVVQELVAQPLALVRAGDEPGHVEQLDGHAAPAVVTGAVVGLAPVGHAMARAGAVDLEVADGALGVDGGEAGAGGRVSASRARVVRVDTVWGHRTGSFLDGGPYQQPGGARGGLDRDPGDSGEMALPTNFGSGICERVERAGLARAGLPNQADQRVSRHLDG